MANEGHDIRIGTTWSPHSATGSPKSDKGEAFDHSWHLRAELARIAASLGGFLGSQRSRGRSPAGDLVQGLVIEDGEAGGLVAQLVDFWGTPQASAHPDALAPRTILAARADASIARGLPMPLRSAELAFELEPHEYDALLLALSVELDPRFGRLIAYLNDHVERTRPTLGLALLLGAEESRTQLRSPFTFLERSIVRDGLLQVEGDGPKPGLSLALAPDLAAHLAENRPRAPETAGVTVHPKQPGMLAALALDDAARQTLEEWAALALAGRAPPLIIAGQAGRGRRTCARAAASEAGLTTVQAILAMDRSLETLSVARRELRFLPLKNALLLNAPPHTKWRQTWETLTGTRAPLILAIDEGDVEAASSALPRAPVVVRIRELGLAQRNSLWAALLPKGTGLVDDDLSTISARFRFSPAFAARAVRRALGDSTADDGPSSLTVERLERACREVGMSAIGPLAHKLTLPYSRADLVVSSAVDRELDLAIAWIQHQSLVLEEWGFARRVPHGRGLTALFAGPSGTGKTMAAQVLARAIGVDAYRIDLSRVVDKYIGETEKNLARLFDEGHAAGAMLFFDEADALFGKRSEVKEAHDRHANLEVGYLLQRIEEYDGITVLATNRLRDLDDAFLRRFQVLIDFPMPTQAERLRIWKGMMPKEAATEADVNIGRLSHEFDISGGDIKNAVLAAAYFAVTESKPIGMEHLQRGARRELLKGGKIVGYHEKSVQE